MLNSGLRTKPLDLLMTKQKSISRTQFRGDLLICRPCLYRILLLKPILSSAHKTVHLWAAKASMLLCFPQKVSENKGWSWWSSPRVHLCGCPPGLNRGRVWRVCVAVRQAVRAMLSRNKVEDRAQPKAQSLCWININWDLCIATSPKPRRK